MCYYMVVVMVTGSMLCNMVVVMVTGSVFGSDVRVGVTDGGGYTTDGQTHAGNKDRIRCPWRTR